MPNETNCQQKSARHVSTYFLNGLAKYKRRFSGVLSLSFLPAVKVTCSACPFSIHSKQRILDQSSNMVKTVSSDQQYNITRRIAGAVREDTRRRHHRARCVKVRNKAESVAGTAFFKQIVELVADAERSHATSSMPFPIKKSRQCRCLAE